jgi:hypothetical protein
MDYLEYYDYEEEFKALNPELCPTQSQIDAEMLIQKVGYKRAVFLMGGEDIPANTNCPECFMDESVLYKVSPGHYVCRCSPLYPDLRPGDLSFTNLACSCDVAYGFLGLEESVETNSLVCKCTSPDLYALLERQHILGVGPSQRCETVKEDPFSIY